MASISGIRDGLAVRLATITGLRTTSYEPDKIAVPAAVVGDVEVTFDRAMGRGLDEIKVTVRLYASRAADRSGQKALDAYLTGSGPSSVKAAIEADRTLGGACSDLRVTGVDGYGVYEVAGTAYYGAEFAVTVYAQGV